MTVAQIAKRPGRAIPKSAISKMETMLFTREDALVWVVPPFQRPLMVNNKVRAVAEELKINGGFIQGVITLGKLHNDKTTYIVDGQHRIEAFKMTELPEAIADVRTCTFDSVAEMAEEFVRQQQVLVRMRPDDVLRGQEASSHALQVIRKTCPFVGYDQIRRGNEYAPILSMSNAVQLWAGSRNETPTRSLSGQTASQIAKQMDDAEVTNLCKILHVANQAWGRDAAYGRLWNSLNLGITMWMYRRIVIDPDRSKRATVLTQDQFKKCLMAVSENGDYIDWLGGRILTDFHRMPCYRRLRAMFGDRLRQEKIENPLFPKPAWAVS
jgi:hypothetical protein